MKTEILAPAGSFEALKAAVLSGADAVYFGTGNFNARRNADNFDGEGLKKAIDYCHLHNVKCHITLNTLVKDDELDEVISTIKRTCSLGADALILQDLAAAKLVREICPEVHMHASTQLSTGTPEGLKLLKELGFSRAVLPRELSLEQIKKIAENSPLELEAFVHGALCMCVSGQCLLSAMLGSRSGNRGLCAQPCRLPFAAENGTGTDLSLKDLSLIEEINELSSVGVCSFKIEGRMKRPEYVAAAVTACRESLENIYTAERKDELKSLFSRSGFTKGYYENKLGRDMFGTRQKENVTSATAELLKKYERLYEKEKPVHKVIFEFTARLGERPVLKASAAGFEALCEGDFICEKAINKELDCEKVKAQLEKCGGTVFYANEIKCDIQSGISAPLSVINAMRRSCLEQLENDITESRRRTVDDFSLPLKNSKKSTAKAKKELYICFNNAEQIPDNISCDRMFLPLDTDADIINRYSSGVIVPRGFFHNPDEIYKKLTASPAEYALCDTLDAVAAAKKAGKKITGGAFLNAFNSVTLSELKKLGVSETVLSYEMTVNHINSLKSEIRTGSVVYGRMPLMLTRNCPVRNGKSCAECNKNSELCDRKGIKFPVVCSNGFSVLLNSRPTYMLDRLSEIKNTDFDVLYFTKESKQQVSSIINAYHNGKAPEFEFTRGLYYRGVE